MSHTYPEINPADIREGDLIRKEYDREIANGETALEYRATSDGHGKGGHGTHFLINRPTPPVELPETPTLGRLSWDCDGQRGSEVAEWMAHKDGVFGGSSRVPAKGVTEFIPGTFVPAESLDALRDALQAQASKTPYRLAIETFLADVNKANS